MYEDRSKVNDQAESVLNVLAIVLHVLGVLMALLFFALSLSRMSAVVKLGANVPALELLVVLITTVLIYVFCGLLPWAGIKVVLNISHSLMYISDDVRDIKNSLKSKRD